MLTWQLTVSASAFPIFVSHDQITHISFSFSSLPLSLSFPTTLSSLTDLRGQRLIFASCEKRLTQKCQAHTIKQTYHHNLPLWCSSERNLYPAPLSTWRADESCNFSCFLDTLETRESNLQPAADQ